MKKTYILKQFTSNNKSMVELDNKRRKKIEDKTGIKFTDVGWIEYKKLKIKRDKY